ncbi:ATP-dependent protease ATPase subunit HslU [Salisediminibacterium halotolerans]|uniref:ATP-dependent protease ATPase subunit HslU n=1 Tax=Salisediminibacterium halotolerans TaxID=517425 RepID=UPI000EB1AEDA|nr:ATP-dependent protease ATPase subunit HslU [Salisediminibacterium halotolerans]RLJ74229.1 ATP-dependent HslUV protease ATP-binding subunit HslU [Actinophytocola xinjiangensis]RPE87679.1 ATP-dependent HslUV protease ATP-binding subunit HslU [Salisediminibacterium halotolerans]TWG35066.1 ATP-dependent HslUV protease ATP-binding subunit HslU [Salisediminibacterium halotolerans]GEL06886.1 ATP-dependent protease ATPase subunit HslU [Salisediminibacterium halotolerans]
MSSSLTPKQIVERLDESIVGQAAAKRSVAVALRNRYRRHMLEDSLKDEITPKNILMIGPTGVGKTEIARRLAKLVGAPFTKVEATKFTEVGYVGRDVESMVRDLVETSIRIVKEEKMNKVRAKAEKQADERLVELLVPSGKKDTSSSYRNPLEMLFQSGGTEESEPEEPAEESPAEETVRKRRERIGERLKAGELEDREVSIEVEEQQGNFSDMMQGTGMEQMGMNMQDMLGSMMPKKTKKRKLPVREARKVIAEDEAHKLIDMEEVNTEAISRAEQLGIIFIDEVDKVAGKSEGQSADVSREGVQRDILPIVEGSTVMTKYGAVKTDHMLFIAAGAFHFTKPSDLIPELQGRFPIRVELDSLTVEDFVRILIEPKHALIKQYQAMLNVEEIALTFTDEAIHRIAEIATFVNDETENIGARRLHTILEKLLEDLSFEACDINMEEITITKEYVEEKLANVAENRDMSRYIL